MNKLLAAGLGVLVAASWPLVAIGDEPPTIAKLIEELRQPDVTARPKTAVALGTYGSAAREAVPALGKMLRLEKSHPQSLAAAQALARIGAAAGPELVPSLKHPAAIVRMRAAWALGMIGPDAADAVPALIAALRDSDEPVRHLAAYALGEMAPKSDPAARPLVAALRDPAARVRKQAAASLRRIGKAAVPALTEALQDKQATTREAAAHALGLLGHDAKGAMEALVKATRDKHAGTRIQAIAALGGIGPAAKEAAPVLFDALKVKHVETQARAAAALLAIDAGSDEKLAATMREITRKVRWATPPVLAQFGRRPKDAVRPLILALKDDDPNQRAAAAVALGNIGRDAKEAVPALKKALEDKDARVRLSAAGALPLIDDATHKQAAQALEQALADLEKRQKVLAALVQAKADPNLQSYYHELTGNFIAAMSTPAPRSGKLQGYRKPGQLVVGVDALNPDTHVGLLIREPNGHRPGFGAVKTGPHALAAIPPLVQGANLIAARGLGSCEPMASVLTQLRTAVYTANKTQGFSYTIQNLGKGVPPQSPWWPTFQTLRQQLLTDLVNLSRGRPPLFARPPTVPQIPDQADPVPGQGVPQKKRPLSRGEFLVHEQLGELLRGLHDRQELLDGLFQQMVRQDPEEIKARLADKEPDVRFVAVQAVADRRLHFEARLIDLLNDPASEVQTAAHQALVRLSRGNDFGPATSVQPAARPRGGQPAVPPAAESTPTVPPAARALAVRAWRRWLLWQDIPGQPPPEWLVQQLRSGPADDREWLLAQLSDWPREDAASILAQTIPLLTAVSEPARGSQGAEAESSSKSRTDEGKEAQQRLRRALAGRLSKLSADVLEIYLQGGDLEIQLAAAAACALRKDNGHVPALVAALKHWDPRVSQAAHEALRELTGQDLGPPPGADAARVESAAASWLRWWRGQPQAAPGSRGP